jgi:SAM-dependent methyltransferase
MAPRLPSLPLPGPLARARTRALASTRRAGVKTLMRAAKAPLPLARPASDLAMRVLFDSLAEDWEAVRADPTYRVGFEQGIAHLPRGFRPRRALDVACGTGIATQALVDRWPGLNVIGTDISPRMIELAAELVPEARFEVASVHALPYEDGEFDLVTALDGMLDVEELLRVLHRKGRLLVVYSKGGTTPISRPLDELAEELSRHGAVADAHTDGEGHVLVVRHGR